MWNTCIVSIVLWLYEVRANVCLQLVRVATQRYPYYLKEGTEDSQVDRLLLILRLPQRVVLGVVRRLHRVEVRDTPLVLLLHAAHAKLPRVSRAVRVHAVSLGR